MELLLICLFLLAAYEIIARRYFHQEVRRMRDERDTDEWVSQLRVWNLGTCFCCSCPTNLHDPYCRNHGGAAGMRPCLEHGSPGKPNAAGEMPLPVGGLR